MYLRTTQRRNRDGSVVRYYALAENVRHPGKGHVEARVVHSFGRADRLDRAALERLVRSIRRVLDADGGAPAPAADQEGHGGALEIEAGFELGVVHVVEQLWARLGIGRAIAARLAAAQLQAPHGAALLDVLAEHGDAIEQEVFWAGVDLFKLDVDLVFYDATTAWFACDDEDAAGHEWRGLTFAPLRKRGHSKEGRDNDPQVIIALAVTRDGMPVRSWVLPGDTADVTTVERIKEDLRQMRLGRALFVGDAGLYAKANLAELGQGAGRYILATPIGRVKEIRDEVLSRPGRYAEVAPNLGAKEVVIGAGERRRRYILWLDRLAGDHPKAACRLVASKRFGPYLSLDAEGRPFIDRAKVRRAEQLDGKFVLTTNDDSLSAADIALGYKGMWIIEACFRKMKTTGLGIRPMFHWTPRRIVAHVKLCVLALMIQRAAEITTEAPWSQLVDVLGRLQAVRYTAEGATIVQASRITPELAALLKKLDVPRPKPILAVG
jgi:hypothetical protein